MFLPRAKPSIKFWLAGITLASGISFFMDTVFYRFTWQLHYVDFSRSAPLPELLLLQHLVYGILLTALFVWGYRGGNAASEGFRFGILAGALSFIPVGISIRAAWYVPLNFGFYLATFHAMVQAIVIGILLQRLMVLFPSAGSEKWT